MAKRGVVPALPPRPPRGPLGVTVAGWLGNVLSYLLLLAAARRLGTADYAELVTLLNLLLIGSVPSFALQAVAARRVATGSADGLLEAGTAIGLAATVLTAALAPALVAFLHLPGLAGPLLVALSMPGTARAGPVPGRLAGRAAAGGARGVDLRRHRRTLRGRPASGCWPAAPAPGPSPPSLSG